MRYLPFLKTALITCIYSDIIWHLLVGFADPNVIGQHLSTTQMTYLIDDDIRPSPMFFL